MDGNIPLSKGIIKEYNLLGSRKYRKKSGKIILEGFMLLDEALKAGVKLHTVLYTPDFKKNNARRELLVRARETGSRFVEVPAVTFKNIAQTENPQGIGAIAHIPQINVPGAEGNNGLFLLLDGIQDPGNLGTIIRTAAAAGAGGLFLLPGTVDLYNPKVLRATMGGLFHLPILEVDKVETCWEILQKKVPLVAADPGGNVAYYSINFLQDTIVVIGNENKGIRKPLLEKADTRAYIPLKGKIAALNAAVAASVFIFEFQRQRDMKEHK